MERTELLNTLKLASPALLNESEIVLPILKSFKFQNGQVLASNDVIAVSLNADIGLEGIVAGKKLLTFLSACRTKEVSFTKTKKGSIIAKAGGSRLTLSNEPMEDWPFEFPDIEGAVTKNVKEGFFTGLEMCSAQSPDTGIGGWAGSIILNFSKEGLEVYGIGRGRSTISYYKVLDARPSKKDRRLILTSSFCKAAVAMSESFGKSAKLHIAGEGVVLEWNEAENIIAGKYVNVDVPDVEGTFASVLEGDLGFIRISDKMKESFKRASALSDKGTVGIATSEGGFDLKTKSESGAWLKERVPVKKDVPTIDVEMAADLISKRLGDCYKIAFTDSAAVMTNKEENFVYLAANRSDEEGENE